MSKKTTIELRTSPHAHAGEDVVVIMRNVVYALLPICAFTVWQFGISALNRRSLNRQVRVTTTSSANALM
ncbi:MAG: RnfABCDGE type electron transport complex subunit D, partial [Candidatus Thiodiazotropha lotti]